MNGVTQEQTTEDLLREVLQRMADLEERLAKAETMSRQALNWTRRVSEGE